MGGGGGKGKWGCKKRGGGQGEVGGSEKEGGFLMRENKNEYKFFYKFKNFFLNINNDIKIYPFIINLLI